MEFEQVWARIVANQGSVFETKTGIAFWYEIDGNIVRPNRPDLLIPKGHVWIALDLWPVPGPARLKKVVKGAAYVWALLRDERIYPATHH